jgi:hypothetical protein
MLKNLPFSRLELFPFHVCFSKLFSLLSLCPQARSFSIEGAGIYVSFFCQPTLCVLLLLSLKMSRKKLSNEAVKAQLAELEQAEENGNIHLEPVRPSTRNKYDYLRRMWEQ